MNNLKRSKSSSGLAGAFVVAGASQAYAAIISVTPPTNIVGPTTNSPSISEYWNAATGVTTTTNVTGDNFRFRTQNTSVTYAGNTKTYFYSFIRNLAGSTTAAPAGNYQSAYNIPSGATIGTGGTFSTFSNFTGFIGLSGLYNGAQKDKIPTGTPAYVGFQFTLSDGVHDGYLQLESDPYVSASNPGGLKFFAADYNSVPDDAQGDGVIAAGATAATPEPGSLTLLALGAVVFLGAGRGRRRNGGLETA